MEQNSKIALRSVIQGICVAFLVILTGVQKSNAADIYVDVGNGACTDVGTGDSAAPFCSIQAAIDFAGDGDDVRVSPGDYSHIVMKSNVNVLGTGSPRLLSDKDESLVKFVEGVQNCTLDGFFLDASGYNGSSAIIVMIGYDTKLASDSAHSTNLTVSNCTLQGALILADSTSSAGISLHGTLQNTSILNNTIRHIYGTAIVVGRGAPQEYPLKYCSVTIEGNWLENNAWGGIFLRSLADDWNKVVIRGNMIRTNRSTSDQSVAQGHIGIGLVNIHRGYEGDIAKEDALTNTDCGWIGDNSCGVIIENNTVADHNLAGVLLENVWSVLPHVVGNLIETSTLTGLNILGKTRATIVNNEIRLNLRSGIAFNSFYRSGDVSSETVVIDSNEIHHNDFAGIGTIDHITGALIITGNNLHDNIKAGISFFNAADDVTIVDNDIHDNQTAGIYTGNWYGRYATENKPGLEVMFDRSAGPVHLKIQRNKIYNNITGIRVDHASGTISNNLVYNNLQAGIRFSGKNVGDFEPFGVPWGVTEVSNNTVSDNGKAGIVYDNINYYPWCKGFYLGSDVDNDGYRDFVDIPRKYRLDDIDPTPITMLNNIVTWNSAIGLRDSTCESSPFRDYNLLYSNNAEWALVINNDEKAQFGGCEKNDNNDLIWTPEFVDRENRDYHLQVGSPAIGNDSNGDDRGAYGGSYPITWQTSHVGTAH